MQTRWVGWTKLPELVCIPPDVQRTSPCRAVPMLLFWAYSMRNHIILIIIGWARQTFALTNIQPLCQIRITFRLLTYILGTLCVTTAHIQTHLAHRNVVRSWTLANDNEMTLRNGQSCAHNRYAVHDVLFSVQIQLSFRLVRMMMRHARSPWTMWWWCWCWWQWRNCAFVCMCVCVYLFCVHKHTNMHTRTYTGKVTGDEPPINTIRECSLCCSKLSWATAAIKLHPFCQFANDVPPQSVAGVHVCVYIRFSIESSQLFSYVWLCVCDLVCM